MKKNVTENRLGYNKVDFTTDYLKELEQIIVRNIERYNAKKID